MAHGPAVPAATMKLCTQWGEYSEVGNDAEGLEEARGGGTVSAPQRDDAIHSWDEGVRTNVYRSVSPSISLSLSFHQLARLLPATLPPLYFGEPSSQWKLDPGFFPFYRTNEHRMARYRSRWGYFSETGLGKNGD